MEPGILTTLMKSFTFTFTSGGARLVPEALIVLGLIAIVEIALIGLWWVWGLEHHVGTLAAKLIGIGCVAVLIQQWHMLTHLLIRGMIDFGLKAGGDVITITDFTDPGNIAVYGFSVTGALFGRLMGYTGWDAIMNLPEILIAAPIALLIVLTYFALALWIFIALVEFYMHAAITTVLLPFAINPKVAFLAEKSIAVICSSGVRVLVLAFVTSATLPVLVHQQMSATITLRGLLSQLLGAMAVCLLAWRADKSAQGLLYGTPQFTITDAGHFVRSTVANISQAGRIVHAMLHLPIAARGGAPRRRVP